MLLTTLTAAAFIWFYFDRKDAKKSEQIIKYEWQTDNALYCLKVIKSCLTIDQLIVANKMVRNCAGRGYIDLNGYHILIKRIWIIRNAIQ